MQPFRLACPHCSSKILVRHAHLVGQTLPCPKCKQPLEVVVPADPLFPAPVPEQIMPMAKPQAAEGVNSAAITKTDAADWNIEHLDTQAFTRVEAPADENAYPIPALKRDGALSEPVPSVGRSPAAPVVAQRDFRAWESENTIARRNLLLVSSIAVSGLLLASLAFFAFVRSFGKPTEQAANNNVVPSVPEAEKGLGKGPGEVAEKTVDPPPVETKTDSEPKDEANDPEASSSEPQSAPVPKPPSDVSDASSNASPLFPEVNVAAPPTQSDPNPSEPPKPPLDNAAVEESLPAIFGDFQRLFDAPSRGTWDDIGKADRTIDSEIALENTEVLFREEYYPAAIPTPAWNERSERLLQSVKTQPMTLLRCIDWFSKITNVGITADWLDLQLAGIDWSEPIVIEGDGQTVGALLTKMCQDRGLEIVVDDDGFPHVRPNQDRMVTLVGPDGVLNLETTLKLLSQEQRDNWIPLVIRMLDITNGTYVQGKVEWGPNATVYESTRLSASLRALQEASANPRAPVQFGQDPFDFVRSEAWWFLKQRLQKKIDMDRIVHEERPIIDLLATASSASGTQLVIDWPSVWSHGLHPSKMSISVLRGRTLEEVANRYLEDFALELVVLDSNTVLLTTDAVRRSMEQVVPVRLDRGMSIDDIKGAIRYLVPRGIEQRSRFRWEPVPGNEQLALLRICLPALVHMRDTELQKAFGFE